MKRLFLLAFLLLFTVVAFAAPAIVQETSGVDITDPSQLVGLLNVVIVFLAAQTTKFVKSIAPTWILAILIPGLSAAGAFILNLILPDTNWILSFAFGFISTYIYELQRQLTSGNRKTA